MSREINFSKLGGPVYVGRDNGELARRKLDVSSLDNGNEPVTVVIPDDTYSVNSSYFLGLFGKSVVRFGIRDFFERYQFRAPKHISDKLEGYAERALTARGELELDS